MSPSGRTQRPGPARAQCQGVCDCVGYAINAEAMEALEDLIQKGLVDQRTLRLTPRGNQYCEVLEQEGLL